MARARTVMRGPKPARALRQADLPPALGSSIVATTALLALWGFISTPAPVGWWTWLSKVLPDDAEVSGGLMVATIQLAITPGATVGGLMFDGRGHEATFAVSAVILCGSTLAAFLASCRAAASLDDVDASASAEQDVRLSRAAA